MKDQIKNIDTIEKLNSLVEHFEIPYKESKDEMWNKISVDIVDHTKSNSMNVPLMQINFRFAFGLVAILLIGIISFSGLYTRTITAPKGIHLAHILPDNSKVDLNAETSIRYKPFIWILDRKVALEGEAFFQVEKGDKFNVVSDNGITEVLGTSFNIFARKDNYKVFCKTGKVKVSSTQTDVDFLIKPGELVIIDNANKKGNVQNALSESIISWKDNKFNFQSESLDKVFEEIGRQYNVHINAEIGQIEKMAYSGYFEKNNDAENSLALICETFNFNLRKVDNKNYIVSHK